MEDRKQSIKVFVDKLLQKGRMRFRRNAFKAYKSNYMFIYENYSYDDVSEASLKKLIKKSIYDIRLRWFIPDILSLTTPESISDELLKICIKYPFRFKKTLLMQLSHMWLPAHKLELLNRNIETEEAFYKLFIYYSTDDVYTLHEYIRFLENNLRFQNQFDDCFQMVIEKGYVISPQKIDILNSYISD